MSTNAVVARSRVRNAVCDLLATGTWESWPVIVAAVSEYTGATLEDAEGAIWRLWRAGIVDIRGRGQRRQVRSRPAVPEGEQP